ncbi:hypothetical protein D9M71_751330 [compost metagenome]
MVHSRTGQFGIGQGGRHAGGILAAVAAAGGNFLCLAQIRVTQHPAQRTGLTTLGMLAGFQHQQRRPFTQHKAAAVRHERPALFLWGKVHALAECAQPIKAVVGQFMGHQLHRAT